MKRPDINGAKRSTKRKKKKRRRRKKGRDTQFNLSSATLLLAVVLDLKKKKKRSAAAALLAFCFCFLFSFLSSLHAARHVLPLRLISVLHRNLPRRLRSVAVHERLPVPEAIVAAKLLTHLGPHPLI